MTYLYEATSEETADIATNYPWGYRMKTEVKFWIETTKRGGRFCKRTKDPRSGKWCAIKKGTYCAVKILVLGDNGKHGSTSLGLHATSEEVKNYKEKHYDNLSEQQKQEIKKIEILNNATEKFIAQKKEADKLPFTETVENKIMANLSYIHTPPRCRKERRDFISIKRDTKEEAREALYLEVNKILSKSKNVRFGKRVTFQPCVITKKRNFTSCQHNLFPIEGRDGCEGEGFLERKVI